MMLPAIGDECPVCGGETDWIEVDIGVGTQRGPRHCMDPSCRWDEEDSFRALYAYDEEDIDGNGGTEGKDHGAEDPTD